MASSQSLQHQFSNTHHTIPTAKARQDQKTAKTKRALMSLSIAVMVPFSLTMTIITLFGSGPKYHALTNKPFWFPPLWLMHLASLASSSLMGLAAWLVWVEGGFNPQSDALPLYIAQVSLSIVWDPLVLVIGAAWLGLVFCVVHFGTIVVCHGRFRDVNPFAGDLVKPSLVWVAYLTLVTYKLIFL